MPPSHRPQTIKQAKKAYRKSGAAVRLSESELAVIERRAVLQERADRIRDREARRKANVKKREERNQREREARQRMGIPDPLKEGIHVGPSQPRLAAFLAVGPLGKRNRDDAETGNGEDDSMREDPMGTGADVTAMQPSSITRSPWRNPLQPIAVNANLIRKVPPTGAKDSPVVGKESCQDGKENAPMGPPPLRPPIQPTSTTPPSKVKPLSDLLETRASETDNGETKYQAKSMPPPPLPNPTKPLTIARPLQKPPSPIPQTRPTIAADECWDDFFASSTQIARELSPPPTTKIPTKPPPLTNIPPPTPPRPEIPTPPPPIPKYDTSDLLTLLSTQDLDFSPNPTQIDLPIILTPKNESTELDFLADISTQDLNLPIDLTQAVSKPPLTYEPSCSSSSNFDEDITCADLEEIVLDFETESDAKSRTTSPNALEPVKDERQELKREQEEQGCKEKPPDAKPPEPSAVSKPATMKCHREVCKRLKICYPWKHPTPPLKANSSPKKEIKSPPSTNDDEFAFDESGESAFYGKQDMLEIETSKGSCESLSQEACKVFCGFECRGECGSGYDELTYEDNMGGCEEFDLSTQDLQDFDF